MSGGREGVANLGLAVALAFVLVASLAPSVPGQGVSGSRATLVFESQTTDDTSVEIEWLNSTDGGFVVLYEEAFLQGVVFESLLGASDYVEPGAHSNVTARFDEPIEHTQDVVAVFHEDTNGNESLDVAETRGAEDGPYQGAAGAVFNVAEVRVEETSQSPGSGMLGVLLGIGLAARATARRS